MIGNMTKTYHNKEPFNTILVLKLPKGIKKKKNNEEERYHAILLDLVDDTP